MVPYIPYIPPKTTIWVFPKKEVPQKWMVYNLYHGTPY